MRLIDADALKKETGKWLTNPTDSRLLADVIDNAPTIDAEPVVRCKNCKWWKPAFKGCDANPCVEDQDAEYFCSRGERKDNETI